jgi:xanthine dehydrogenase accessory factor
MTSHWADIVARLNHRNQAYVLVTVLGVKGSAPRDSGTKMVVTLDKIHNTIGGGNLEYLVTEQARTMLQQPTNSQHLEHYPLGPKLGQCCGGNTTILFESFASSRADLMLFGAGHVGTALSKIMLDLPVSLRWVDNRVEQFPPKLSSDKVRAIVSDEPTNEITSMPSDSYFIIMTHDHDLDFRLCVAILKRGDARFIGLIGSATKWLRFRKRLSEAGFSEAEISQIQCPIGLDKVPGKRPMEVAVSVASQFIADYQSRTSDQGKQQGVQWKQFKAVESTNKKCGECHACETSTDE